jgi:hypothetical protein
MATSLLRRHAPCFQGPAMRSFPHTRQPGRLRFTQGYDLARKAALEFLETFKQAVDPGDREVMRCVARTSLTTKLAQVRVLRV